jgi:hypothetical protein
MRFPSGNSLAITLRWKTPCYIDKNKSDQKKKKKKEERLKRGPKQPRETAANQWETKTAKPLGNWLADFPGAMWRNQKTPPLFIGSVFAVVWARWHFFQTKPGDPQFTVDYRCEDRKKVDELRDDIGAIRQVLTPSFRKPWSSYHKKQNRSARRCIWRYSFQAAVWNCQILNQVVESQLFTPLWNRYHQWLSDIELIQIRAFISFLFQD